MTRRLHKLGKLPDGWVPAALSDIVEKPSLSGRKLMKKEYQAEGRIPVVDQGQAFIGGYTSRTELRVDCALPVIVFGDHTRVLKYIDFDFVAGADGVKVLEPVPPMNPKLLYYFLHAVRIPDRGYSRHFQFLEKAEIPVPPLEEQRRIVAKIEELLTKLDAGVEALKKVKGLLKRYRQSVLKSAFEGKLIGDSRIDSDNKIPERIDHRPAGWKRMRVSDIIAGAQYGISVKANRNPSGIAVLRMGNIQKGGLSFEDLKYLPRSVPDLHKYVVVDGDVLFNRTNSAELVGKSAVYREHHPEATFASYLIRLTVGRNLCNPDFLSFYINSCHGRAYIRSVQSQQVGQANVNATKLRAMPISVPPLDVQESIVEEIQRRFSVADALDSTAETAVSQAGALRQAVLKMAFDGWLVPQCPEDEQAGRLLDEIRSHRRGGTR